MVVERAVHRPSSISVRALDYAFCMKLWLFSMCQTQIISFAGISRARWRQNKYSWLILHIRAYRHGETRRQPKLSRLSHFGERARPVHKHKVSRLAHNIWENFVDTLCTIHHPHANPILSSRTSVCVSCSCLRLRRGQSMRWENATHYGAWACKSKAKLIYFFGRKFDCLPQYSTCQNIYFITYMWCS